MERNNQYLDKLLKVQNELQDTQKRLDVLEIGRPLDSALQSEGGERNAHATFRDFLSPDEIQAINRSFNESLNKKVECDRLDYALACSCGIISGLIDILLVKSPHEGILGDASDQLVDKALITLAGKKNNGEDRSIASAIAFFEGKAKVTYDQAKTQEITKQLTDGFTETIEHLSTKNHHAKSLAHYPDIFGLIASICNQFTNTSTFLNTGKGRITIVNGTDSTIELQGNTLPAKIFSGFVNWLLHCLSDIAGSSGNRGPGSGPGTGLPIPFTEFFQFCNFGTFKNEKGQNQTIATVMVKVYEEGYDLRHGIAASVPVLINDLLLRAVFMLKQHFYDKVSWKDLFQKKNEDKLQRMISVGTGALCLIDLSEAVITSWGNWVVFFSHLNISAWSRLAIQGVKELHILSDREMHNIEMIEQEICEKRQDLLQRSRALAESAL
ncbi:MAG: hypothetical protein Q4D99_06935 [Bacillota bacterium]|nr:hypothetical protein [Bacillota bacterium]